jgi:hydroxypyruvate isomerase
MTNRRNAIKMLAGATAAGTALHAMGAGILDSNSKQNNKLKGNINHAVCRWTYGHLSLDELCVVAKDIGIKAIDLVGPKDWGILKKHGLDSSMCNGAEISLTEGWNDKKYHATLVKNYTEHIELVSAAGYKNLICFSGNRKGMDDETGMKNCVEGLKKVIGLAEKKGVVLQMELFNSKVNHPDYMADKSAWGVELCKQLGSEKFKLLYDIYHMQINEGDIIHTIEENHQYFWALPYRRCPGKA